MERAIIFTVIAIVIFVVRFVVNQNKKANQNTRRKVTKTPPPLPRKNSPPKRDIFSELNDRLSELQNQSRPPVPRKQSKNRNSSGQTRQNQPTDRFATKRGRQHNSPAKRTPPPAPRHTKQTSPFLEREVRQSRENHYSEESLADEWRRTHKLGKEVAHHDHTEELRDSPDIHGNPYVDEDEGALSQKEANKRKRSEKNSKIGSIIKTKSDFRRAIVLKEILDPKYKE